MQVEEIYKSKRYTSRKDMQIKEMCKSKQSVAFVFEINKKLNLKLQKKLSINVLSIYAIVLESKLRQLKKSVFSYASNNKNSSKYKNCNTKIFTKYKIYSFVLYIR